MKHAKYLALTAGLLASTAAVAQERFITIGTGGQTGVYFVVGQSICRLVNRDTAETGLQMHRALDRRLDRQHQRDQGGRHGHGRGPVRLAVPRL